MNTTSLSAIEFCNGAAANVPAGRQPLSVCWGAPLSRETPVSLPDALSAAAARATDRAILHIQPDESIVEQTYSGLLSEAERILAGLQVRGVSPGDVVVFQLNRSQDFLAAFWACVLGGIVPVPLSVAPSYSHPNAALARLENVGAMLGDPPILTTGALAPAVEAVSGTRRVVSIEDLRTGGGDARRDACRPDDLALLLLTSGSTGTPKAVMLSHANMLARSAGTTSLNGFGPSDVSLNWFPLDHVGGIVMFHVRDVCLGCTQIHAPIDMVLEEPLRWLDWIERYRVTVTWAPNFAYGLVNDRAERIESGSWELSSVRFILNAGEAIAAKTVRRFMSLLAPHALRPDCMHPAWGMSETSSAFTYSDRFSVETARDEDAFVPVGVPIAGAAVRIVDAGDVPLPEGEIGRLHVSGPSVTRGYFRNPGATADSFTADGWFKTGDLGIVRDGQLSITGREKDVIIVNGINYHSHEIEAVVEEIDGIEPSFAAACAVRAVDADTDRLAVFFVPSDSYHGRDAELIREVRSRVMSRTGLNPSYVLPVSREDIPKTAIGKIQRTQLRQRLEAGEFASAFKRIARMRSGESDGPSDAPSTALERLAADVWEEVLGVGSVGVRENLFELGGDSLAATRIVSRLRKALGIDLGLSHLFAGPTIAQLCVLIDDLEVAAIAGSEADAEDIDSLLSELEGLSDAEAASLLRSSP